MSDSSSRSTRLLTLGAAAVVSIYAAGFDRTRPAARRLAEEDAAHRRPPAAHAEAVPPPPALATIAPAPASDAPPPAPPAALERAAPAKPPGTQSPEADSVVVRQAVPAEQAPVIADSTPAPVQQPPVADTAAIAASKPKWRDGTYTGWGDSRHGSIEATVTIKEGRILEAYISRCLTRYSCSWIEHLQIQVVDRQGPDVDFVSGATQSTNAFYYAVVEALGRAKTP